MTKQQVTICSTSIHLQFSVKLLFGYLVVVV